MDFGGFILFLIGALGTVAGLVIVVVLFATRHPARKVGLGLLVGGVTLLTVLGAHLHKAYGLNEPLVSAAMSGDAKRVRALLARGADPNATWEDGTSAIEYAKRGGHAAVIELLRKAGANE
jgi:hypothetical protein